MHFLELLEVPGSKVARQRSCIGSPRIPGNRFPESEIETLDVLLFPIASRGAGRLRKVRDCMYFPEFLEVPGAKVMMQRACIPKPRMTGHTFPGSEIEMLDVVLFPYASPGAGKCRKAWESMHSLVFLEVPDLSSRGNSRASRIHGSWATIPRKVE